MQAKLLKEIVEKLSEENGSLEDLSVEVDGIAYGVTEHMIDKWDDEGKYQFTTEHGTLCSYDENYKVVDSFPIFLERGITRSGSYFSDYNYDYDDIQVYELHKVTVPEQIIPEHTETKRVYIIFE